MKMINGFILALIISTSPVVAETNSPAPVAPSSPTVAPSTNTAPEIAPAKKTKAKAKPTAKKSKKTKAPAKAPKTAPSAEPSSLKPTSHVAIEPPDNGLVLQRNVNVRGQPSFIGEVITKLHKGETVKLLEEITLGKTKQDEPSQWFRIAMPSNTPVWVNASFLDQAGKTVVPKRLKVRAGPGENFSVVGFLKKGDVVKEIRTVSEWSEIETPPDTYAFVAADLIERTPAAPIITPPAVVAPEVVAVPPTQVNAPPPAVEAPATTPPATPPPAENVTPTVVPATPPPVEEPLPKRIVTREGIVRRSINIQTPSYFALENPETRKIINYLYNPQPGFTLKSWIGMNVVVTGEESIDKRWPNTPVIEIETIDPR